MDSITTLLGNSLLLIHTSNSFHINTYETTVRKRYLKHISFKTSTEIPTKSGLVLKSIFISFTCFEYAVSDWLRASTAHLKEYFENTFRFEGHLSRLLGKMK